MDMDKSKLDTLCNALRGFEPGVVKASCRVTSYDVEVLVKCTCGPENVRKFELLSIRAYLKGRDMVLKEVRIFMDEDSFTIGEFGFGKNYRRNTVSSSNTIKGTSDSGNMVSKSKLMEVIPNV